jgi:hypothetical protein
MTAPYSQEPAYKDSKAAWMLVYAIHPYCINYPGVIADLYFSSPEAFAKLWERPLGRGEALVEITVPNDFDNWDYIPDNY